MKTLDEVIDDFEKACDLERRCEDCSGCLDQEEGCPNDGAESVPDALEYLKEYRMQLDDIAAKRKVLSFKIKQYDEMVETVKKQGQEHEDRCQAEIARYQEAVRNCEAAELKYRQLTGELGKNLAEPEENLPLDWDELKQMEGKPVWIELLDHDIWEDPSHRVDSEWWVIGEVRKADIIAACYLDEIELCENDLGKTWQAYRKERG